MMIYLEYIILIYFSYCVLYTFFFSASGNFGKIKNSFSRKHSKTEGSKFNKIAVFIPAYKEDEVIIPVIQEVRRQDYPIHLFDVVVIADHFKQSTLDKLKEYPIKLIEVNFENSTKSKALNKAMDDLKREYDIALVLDADNVMEPGYLKKVNEIYNQGYKVIQTNRKAKNKDSSYAILDALSEILNNHILRKGHTALGMSSSLTGSGMAFDYQLFKTAMKDIHAIGGFDRELEYRLLEMGYKAVYFEDVTLYDEKIARAKAFSNQRRRWISSQFYYLKKYLVKGLKRDPVYFNSTVLRNLLLPRLIVLGLLFIFGVLSMVFIDYVQLPPMVWWVLLGINLLAFILAVPLNFYNKQFFRAIFYIPQAFVIMLMLLFKLKGANKKFIHTPHGHSNA